MEKNKIEGRQIGEICALKMLFVLLGILGGWGMFGCLASVESPHRETVEELVSSETSKTSHHSHDSGASQADSKANMAPDVEAAPDIERAERSVVPEPRPEPTVESVASVPEQKPPVNASCASAGGRNPVAAPVFVRQIKDTGTSWFGSPAIVDLDNDGKKEIVGTMYDVFVWNAQGKELARAKSGQAHHGRIYMPAVVADLDKDGVMEVAVGGSQCSVAVYEYRQGKLVVKAGWPVKACRNREGSVEVRGMAAADLDGDGTLELVVTTTQNEQDAQVWVFRHDGQLYQPKGLTAWPAWPRYNTRKGAGGDADANGCGHRGYGAYGLNVAIGNLDQQPDLEIVVTYDNHRLQVFKSDGTALLAAPYFKNRDPKCVGSRMSWGQFFRWLDPTVEANHYNLHKGEWPEPKQQIWMQWTASPPVVADLNRDGKNEVISIPNAEKNEPYETQFYPVVVLEGNHDANRAAMRLSGWENPPRSGAPQPRPSGWYPPEGIPTPTVVDMTGDGKPEIIAPLNDGWIHVISPDGKPLWTFDYRHGRSLLYASEVVVVDLNRDGKPELLFTTWGSPGDSKAGWLVILDAQGKLLHDIALPVGTNPNGAGYPAAPTVGDVDGNGTLEILVQSFGNGLLMFTVPGSAENCLLWPTARANLLRNAQGPAYR